MRRQPAADHRAGCDAGERERADEQAAPQSRYRSEHCHRHGDPIERRHGGPAYKAPLPRGSGVTIIASWRARTTRAAAPCRPVSTRAGSPTGSTRSSFAPRSTTTTAPSSSAATCSSWRPPTARGARTARTRAARPASSAWSTTGTLAFPSYDGNGMYLKAGQPARQPAGRPALHRLPGAPRGYGVNGVAPFHDDDPLLAEYPEAQLDHPRARRAGLPELPALHPRVPPGRPLAVRARARARRRRSPSGSGPTGRTTRCRSPTPRATTSARSCTAVRPRAIR